jgi:transposase-like protein
MLLMQESARKQRFGDLISRLAFPIQQRPKQPFKWRHFLPEIILLCVRWYLRYPLSYRNLSEMMVERGLSINHTTIYRWIIAYSLEINQRCRQHLLPTNDSWRVDETYIKVQGKWKYLYRAIDSEGNTIDFLLTANRDATAAKRFLKKALKQSPSNIVRVINTDKAKAYPKAIEELKNSGVLSKSVEHRTVKYLNNIIEQDHRYTKRRVVALA